MNEEEKKAVEILKSWKDYNIRNKNKLLQAEEIINVQETILNLIEKLQKENEELKEENEHLHREINRRIKLKIENEKIVDTQFIYKQKIKNKIEKLHKLLADIDYKDIEDEQEREFYKKEYYQVVAQIKVLQDLLDESEENKCGTN